MRCPHCCSETFMLSDVDLKAEVRKYTDSAYLTFKMTMNKGAPTLNPTLNYPITKDGCCIQSPRQLISGNQVIEIGTIGYIVYLCIYYIYIYIYRPLNPITRESISCNAHDSTEQKGRGKRKI